MKIQFYLTVSQNGSIKVSKGKPGLDYDQVSILCNLQLPNSLFVKPQINASIIVNEDDVKPFEFDAETQNNVKEAIEVATGINVKLTIGEPEQ